MRRFSTRGDDDKPDNPQTHANWFSVFSFWYTLPIFRLGNRRDLDERDLTKPLDVHKSGLLGERLATVWSAEVIAARERYELPSLTRALYRCFHVDIIIYGAFFIGMEMIRLMQPLFLGLLLRYFNAENKLNKEPMRAPMYLMRLFSFWTPQSPILIEEALIYAFGIVFCTFVSVATIHPCMCGIMHLGMKIRVACCSLIYRKAVRIDLVTCSGATVGNVVNLISNDVNRFDMALMFLHYLWIGPLQMCFFLYFMYREVKISAVAGIAVLCLFIPLQAWFGTQTSKFRLQTALRTDERVRQMNEIITGMQVIKMYTWEYAFSTLISELRQHELKVLQLTSYIRGMVMSFIMFASRLAIFCTVICAFLNHVEITAERVFIITTFYQLLRHTMTLYFPQAIAQLAECSVAIYRIQSFLMTPECTTGDPSALNPKLYDEDDDEIGPARIYIENNDRHISLVNASLVIDGELCLENISTEMMAGRLTAIIGHVGSGKSILLNLILGEMKPLFGGVTAIGEISYAAQEPWLFAGTVRQNILFGHEFERSRYYAVIRACALVRDFGLLPYGDQTVVGERGISLSGGQRARINLARAVYKRADIYLLDDPLSAVDSNVGKQLFESCVRDYLADKVVVLVTHQLQYLNTVEHIILMDDGRIAAQGTYTELENSGLSFSAFLREQLPVEEMVTQAPVNPLVRRFSMKSSTLLGGDVIDIEGKVDSRVQQEIQSSGAIGWYVYGEYFRAGGNCCQLTNVTIFFLTAQFLVSFNDWWLGEWVNTEEYRIVKSDIENNRTTRKIAVDEPLLLDVSSQLSIIVYSVIMGAAIVVCLTRSVFFFMCCMRASARLHDNMFNSIIRASKKFFDTNSSGRILNRFSKDLGAIDEMLPNSMIDTVQIMLSLVGSIVVIASVNPILMAPTTLICLMFYFIRRCYLNASRSIKRLDGITRSPCIAHLNASLQGLATVRSHKAERILAAEFDRYQDVHSSAWFIFIITSRAFSSWTDWLCAVYIGIVAFSFFVFENTGSRVGLAITQAIGLTGLFQWGMRQSAEMVNQMTSVERVLEFSRVEHEPALESKPDKKPPISWPPNGKIEFRNLVMRYQPNDPPVLKYLTFDINAKEKIGIVGRTGAGKSSLIAALFRLAPYEGKVVIDGYDTMEMGLHDLRGKISIIPQEPVIFTGSLRYNMDPFNQYDDFSIVKALLVVEIKAAILRGTACLKELMKEGGTNVSVGERQMICLARAILRNNIILVLDEATANVDAETDHFIQSTIREKFGHCTVLTIAHRLHTIMDSDRVLVMDAGAPVEFDHPHILLQIQDGFLTKMVEKTGPGMEERLRQIAKKSFRIKSGDVPESRDRGSIASTVSEMPEFDDLPPVDDENPDDEDNEQ